MRFEDIVFVYHLRDEAQMAWHGRLHVHAKSLHEFHYFAGGSGSFRNGAARFRIEPGTLYHSAPGMEHQILADELRSPITYYAMLVDAADDVELGELLARPPFSRGAPMPVGGARRFFFADILEKHFSGKADLERSARHQLLAFLYGVAGGASRAEGAADNAHVEKALAIMQSSIERPLDLAGLASRLQLSREHFARVFAARMGMGPMQYHARLKVEAARAMLSSTNLRVQEIADRLGWANQFGFARAFRRICGMSPSEYRSRCLQRADFAHALEPEE